MDFIKRDELINLFETYKLLLTSTQIKYFTDYYLDDLSLAEISENYGVSRSAVFDQIKKVSLNLETLESKLKINYKNKKILELLDSKDFNKEAIRTIIEEWFYGVW